MRLLRSPAMPPVSKLLPIAALLAGLSACGGGGDDNFGPIVVSAGDTFALTSGNRLISFNRAVPGTARTSATISGLTAGETLVGIDFRPANGTLYGVSTASRIYTIDTATGVATAGPTISLTAGGAAIALRGTAFGVDFNPVPDRLRVVSDAGQNLRINVTDGVTIEDIDLSGPGSAGVTSVAYTNSFSNACRTSIFYLDTTEGTLLTASGNPNAGVTTTVGALGAAAATPSPVTAFEISSVSESSNTGFAAVTTATGAQLLAIDLATGAATSRGGIGGALAEQVRGLAMAPPATLPTLVTGELFGLTASNRLVSFNRAAPAKLCTSAAIAPLNAGENVVGIDFRPSTGALHALANASGTARLLTLDPATAAVTSAVPLSVALTGTEFGMDFNPTGPVALRIVSDTGQNLRVNDGPAASPTAALTGATTMDGALNPATTGATAAAYTNSVQGTGTTTLFVIDTNADTLNVQNPPNAGTLTLPLPLASDFAVVNGFDIDGRDNVAFLAGSIGAATTSSLHTVDLTTGAASASLGTIGGGETLRGLARPTPTTTVIGLTTANELVQISLTDASTTTIGAVTGLAGENLVGIDFRSSTGLLYGVGSAGGLFTIDAQSAAATRVALSADAADTGADGTAAFSALAGTAFGVDFNPMPAGVPLRVVSDAEQNLRVSNPITGSTFTDVALTRGAATFSISAVGYTNSFSPTTSTVLYGLDAAGERLVAINAPNSGIVRVIGSVGAGLDVTANSTLEIAGPSTALAVFDGATTKILYTVNLASGAATAAGAINTADAIVALSAPISSTDPLASSTVFAMGFDIGTLSYNLLSFARNAPGTLLTDIGVTGLGAGETVVGMDFRSLGGQLYVLTNLAGVASLYTVDTATGVATPAGTLSADPLDVADLTAGNTSYTGLSGTAFGMDFNPLPASVPLRIISDTGQNLRVTSLMADATFGRTFTDGSIGQGVPNVHAAAYTNSYTPNPTSTMLFVIDQTTGSLLQQGAVAPPGPNGGVLTQIGALSAADSYSTTASGFDIAGGANGIALAALQRTTPAETASRLYRINLATGAATEVVPSAFIGGVSGVPLRGLAVRVR